MWAHAIVQRTLPGRLIPKIGQQVEGTPPAAAIQSLRYGSSELVSASPGDTASLHINNAAILNMYWYMCT